MHRRAAFLFLVLVPSFALAADFQVGEKVFVKPDADARINEMKVDVESIPRPSAILKMEGEKVFLGKAWVLISDVMTAEEALKFYSDQIRNDPKNSMLYVHRGRVRWGGDLENAFNDFNEAVRLDPKNSRAYRGRGLAWGKKHEFENALKDLTEAISLDPTSAKAYDIRGTIWQDKGELDKAIDDYTESIRIDPTVANVYYNRGCSWEAKRRFENAIKDYSKSIQLDPTNADSYINRGNVWKMKGELDNAIKDYTEGARLNPTNANPYTNRAIVFREKGELDNAIRDFSESIRIDPTNAGAYNGRGLSRFDKGDFEKATSDYRDAIKLDPSSFGAHCNFAWMLSTCPDDNHRDGIKAVEYALKACELCESKRWECMATLAAAYAESGDFSNAIQCAERSLELAPEDVKVGLKGSLELFRSLKPYRDYRKNPTVRRGTL